MIKTVYCHTCERAFSGREIIRGVIIFNHVTSGEEPRHDIGMENVTEHLSSFKIGDSWEKLAVLIKADHIRISADFRRTEKDVSRLQNYIDQHGLFVARTQVIDAGRIRDELRDERKKVFDVFPGLLGPATDSESPAE